MDYNAVWMFVQVVQAGSFSGAARQIGVPKSTVSKRVAALEEALRITLLTRTTRKLKLTDAGRAYYESSVRAFAELGAAELETHATQKSPRGILRVTAPAEMASAFMAGSISEFMNSYPEVDVQLVITDDVLDLVSSSVDVAIRVGKLEDSSLIARRLGTSCFRLFASPRYIKARGMPQSPSDLEGHRCLRFNTLFEGNYWDLQSGQRRARVKIAGRFSANNIAVLKAMAAEGHGITLLPVFTCQVEVQQGKLVPVLPRWATGDEPVHMVYPQQKFTSPRQQVFIDFMAPRLRQALLLPDPKAGTPAK
ncbi:LysR family transcriptional regulator [Bdellovibrionota bacterium FG-1]